MTTIHELWWPSFFINFRNTRTFINYCKFYNEDQCGLMHQPSPASSSPFSHHKKDFSFQFSFLFFGSFPIEFCFRSPIVKNIKGFESREILLSQIQDERSLMVKQVLKLMFEGNSLATINRKLESQKLLNNLCMILLSI